MLQVIIVAIVHQESGNNISNFHMFEIKTLYFSVVCIVQNELGNLRYYLHIRYIYIYIYPVFCMNTKS